MSIAFKLREMSQEKSLRHWSAKATTGGQVQRTFCWRHSSQARGREDGSEELDILDSSHPRMDLVHVSKDEMDKAAAL